MKSKILLLFLGACLIVPFSRAMLPGGSKSSSPGSAGGDTTNSAWTKKAGSFFITPFYQYTHFTKLKLHSNTNHLNIQGSETEDPYNQEDIDEYNNYYSTEYTNSMMGLKAGYQVMNGLGVSVYAGVSHFNLRSWISDLNTQTLSTQYPGLLLGASVEYEHTIRKNLIALGIASLNYCQTGSGQGTTPSGADIVSAKLSDISWDANLAIAYRLHRFLPYAGAGYTQQFINSVTTEQYVTNDTDGNPYTEQDQYNSWFRGNAFYGFAGLEFSVTHLFSMYVRGTFLNPVRATVGLKMTL